MGVSTLLAFCALSPLSVFETTPPTTMYSLVPGLLPAQINLTVLLSSSWQGVHQLCEMHSDPGAFGSTADEREWRACLERLHANGLESQGYMPCAACTV